MKDNLEEQISAAVIELFGADVNIELTRPEEQFGDYATNAALQLAKSLGKTPRDIAEALAVKLRETLADIVSEVSIAGPGFINIRLNDQSLISALDTQPAKDLTGQEILVEFGDPNPFKEMHVGHLYSYAVGDAICLLLQIAGATVRRLSYHGDVGLHVAKAIWGMRQEGFKPDTSTDIGYYYAMGALAYAENEAAKQEIDLVNAQVYQSDSSIKELYDQGKERSFAYFDQILSELGIQNDKRYFESESAPIGIETVRQNTGQVFTESKGAVVYEGEKVGLHTRVFITGRGLPTYETKDLGLTELKDRDYPDAKRSLIITAHEQAEYFKVMLAALAEIKPELADKTRHLSHGFVSLSTGKMSSRTGEVYSALSLITDVKQAAQSKYDQTDKAVQIGAIKYEFIKHRLGGDIVYDIDESVSLEGNSGPYLQYAHARARSILSKAETTGELAGELQPDERSLARKAGEYTEVVNKAVNELMPHHICTYLYELAQAFNRFYEHNRVIGDERQALRLGLVSRYAETLKNGLNLLGIAAPDRM